MSGHCKQFLISDGSKHNMDGTCNACVFPLAEHEHQYFTAGLTSIMYAAFKGRKHCVQELITAGADVNEEDGDGGTALIWTAAGDQLQAGAQVETQPQAAAGAEAGTQLQAEAQADVQLQAKAHLCNAAEAETQAETRAEALLNNSIESPSSLSVHESKINGKHCNIPGADVNSKCTVTGVNGNKTRGDVKSVKCEQDVNEQDFVGCAKLLLAAGAEVNLNNQGAKATAMAKSAFYGNCRCVEFLITAGADVNATTQDDVTVLIASVMNTVENCEDLIERISSLYMPVFHRHDQCVELLLAAGADMNAADVYGTSALMNAAANGYKECVLRLLHAGADVNATDTTGRTPLHFASQSLETDCAELLLQSGANVNSTCHSGFTALHYFGTSDSTRGVKMLLLAGAHVNKNNMAGHNALEHAIPFCDPEEDKSVLKLLFAAGEILSGREVRRTNISMPVPGYLLHEDVKLELKHMCREAIRNHVIDLSPEEHLFNRIPRLNGEIPYALVNYLLYHESLEMGQI